MSERPTKRQRQIAEFIAAETRDRGLVPTEREIGAKFGFKSRNAVRSHLSLMEKKGMLTRTPGKARSLQLAPSTKGGIPVFGRIRAGAPTLAVEDAEEVLPFPPTFFKGHEVFGLHVKGDSMKDAGIFSGDVAVLNRQPEVRNGDIAAVLLDDDATLKFFHRHKGAIVLRAGNSEYPDIVVSEGKHREIRILGRLVGLVRKFGGAG